MDPQSRRVTWDQRRTETESVFGHCSDWRLKDCLSRRTHERNGPAISTRDVGPDRKGEAESLHHSDHALYGRSGYLGRSHCHNVDWISTMLREFPVFETAIRSGLHVHCVSPD